MLFSLLSLNSHDATNFAEGDDDDDDDDEDDDTVYKKIVICGVCHSIKKVIPLHESCGFVGVQAFFL